MRRHHKFFQQLAGTVHVQWLCKIEIFIQMTAKHNAEHRFKNIRIILAIKWVTLEHKFQMPIAWLIAVMSVLQSETRPMLVQGCRDHTPEAVWYRIVPHNDTYTVSSKSLNHHLRFKLDDQRPIVWARWLHLPLVTCNEQAGSNADECLI